MRCSKVLMIIFYLCIYSFVSWPGYCLYRDDMDPEEIIRKIEKKREENKVEFNEIQKKKELAQKEKDRNQELISQNEQNKQEEQKPSKPKRIAVLFLILSAVVGAAIYYRNKNKQS